MDIYSPFKPTFLLISKKPISTRSMNLEILSFYLSTLVLFFSSFFFIFLCAIDDKLAKGELSKRKKLDNKKEYFPKDTS